MKEQLIDKICELAQIHRATLHEHREYFHNLSKPRGDRANLEKPNVRFGIYYPCIIQLMPLFGDVDVWDAKFDKLPCKGGTAYTYRRREDVQTPSGYTHIINFTMMYPNIMLKLYDAGIMKYNNEAFGKMVNELFRCRDDIKTRFNVEPREDTIENYLFDRILSDDVWYLTKILINCTYTELASESKFKATHFKSIATYAKGQFDQLVEMLGAFVQEINVDEIRISHYNIAYVKDIVHHVLDKTGLPYTIEEKDE